MIMQLIKRLTCRVTNCSIRELRNGEEIVRTFDTLNQRLDRITETEQARQRERALLKTSDFLDDEIFSPPKDKERG
jgi:DNA-binding MarR family transcriptional regulator